MLASESCSKGQKFKELAVLSIYMRNFIEHQPTSFKLNIVISMSVYVHIYILKCIHLHGVYSFLFTDILKGSFCPFILKSFSSNILFLIKCNHKSLKHCLPTKNPANPSNHIFKIIFGRGLISFHIHHHSSLP